MTAERVPYGEVRYAYAVTLEFERFQPNVGLLQEKRTVIDTLIVSDVATRKEIYVEVFDAACGHVGALPTNAVILAISFGVDTLPWKRKHSA